MTTGERGPADLSRLFADLIEVVEPTLDPRAIVRKAQKLLLEALAIDFAGIYLLTAEGDLQVAEGTLFEQLAPEQRRVSVQHPLIVRLVETRRPVRVPVSEHVNTAAAELLAARGVTKLVITPFVAGERLLGIFVCSRVRDPDLSELTDEVFQGLGRVVGVALEQARLLAEARTRADADRALLEAARFAAVEADVDAILAKYAEALARTVGAVHCGIVLPVPDDAVHLRLAASFGLSPEEVAELHAMPFERTTPVTRHTFETRRLGRFATSESQHAACRRFLERHGFAHFYMLPFVARDVVHGVAFLTGVASIEPNLRVVSEAVGHEIALAIEAANEREAARRRAGREALEEELRHAVRASFDLGAILQGAVDKLGRGLDAARCYAGAALPGRATTRRVTNEWRRSTALPPATEWRLDGERPIARALLRSGLVVCNDVFEDSRFGSIEANAPGDLRAFVITSFVENDPTKGWICVAETDRARRWKEEEIRLVRTVADHCAIAVRRAEIHEDAQRRASELELTISQMTDAVVMVNERLEVVRSNAAAQHLLWGLPLAPGSPIPQGRRIVVQDVDGRELAPEELPIVRAVRFGEVVRDRELVIRLSTEEKERAVVSSASPIHDGAGRLVGGVIVMRDVTEARAAAAHAARTEKLRVVGELAASVAHDINNTLAAVLGGAELIAALSRTPASARAQEEIRRNADVIAQAARDASVILARLTRLSQRTHGAAPRDRVDLALVADDAIDLTRPRWGRPGTGIAASLDANGPLVVRGVATELREVVTNLILNSVDAMPRGGRIRVRVDREGEDALLEVRDEGVGMTEDVLRHAFEPFFTTKGDAGTGLGLSISSAIVAAHGGRMDAESKPGAGTTIRVRLPVAADAGPKTPRPSGARRILVVDDDARIRALVADLLVADGHSVLTAGSGEEALAAIEREGAALDVLVTDFLMPGMSGLELAEAARARQPRLGLVVVSGFCADAPASELERLGARVVTKPFRSEDVRSAVLASSRVAAS